MIEHNKVSNLLKKIYDKIKMQGKKCDKLQLKC